MGTMPIDTTAALLALMLQRSGKPRIRVSDKSLRVISARVHLRGAFLTMLQEEIMGWGIVMLRRNSGGWTLFWSSALETALPVLAKDLIQTELRAARRGSFDMNAALTELGYELPEAEE